MTPGLEVRADFDEDIGYPKRLVIEGSEGEAGLDWSVSGYEPSDQVTSCASATPGGPTDIRAEPNEFRESGGWLRWHDREGCSVRIDVVSYRDGLGRCNWEDVEILTISEPLGSPVTNMFDSRTDVWDPTSIVEYIDGVSRNTVIEAAELPESAYDTGYRRNGARMWLLADDHTVLYRVLEDTAEFFVIDTPRRILCE